MLKAVIFDMDGVLVDSEPLHYEANRLLLERKFNINLDYEYYKQFIGSTVTYMWEKMRSDFMTSSDRSNRKDNDNSYVWEDIGRYTALELRDMADEIKEELINTDGYMEIEGAPRFVKSLKGLYKLAVASSSYLKNIERNVNNLGIDDCFRELISGTEVKKPKPSPDIFLEAAARLGVKPNECVVVEDSENGVRAAKVAGMACVGFINENSGNQNLSMADYLFESFEAIDGDFLEMVHAHCFDERYVVAQTKRLCLREMLAEDADDVAVADMIRKALSMNVIDVDDEVNVEAKTNEELRTYITEYRENSYKFLGFGLWLMELKEDNPGEEYDGKVIGIAGVDRKENGDFELGYYVSEKYRRQGYAYEACEKILKISKEELGLEDIGITIAKDNEASMGLAKKLGLEKNL